MSAIKAAALVSVGMVLTLSSACPLPAILAAELARLMRYEQCMYTRLPDLGSPLLLTMLFFFLVAAILFSYPWGH